MNPLPLTLADHQRLLQSIYGAFQPRYESLAHSCITFACCGATLLREIYQLPATVSAGAAAFAFGNSGPPRIILGGVKENEMTSNGEEFHCWIEIGDTILDLMVPIFSELGTEQPSLLHLPSQMFQKQRSEMATNTDDLNRAGDYLFIRNPALEPELVEHFWADPVNRELTFALSRWYKKPRFAMNPAVARSRVGEDYFLQLRGPVLTGSW
jgi:hypothetical protein